MSYINYHKHCHYSNIMSQDSAIKPQDYLNRAVELKHKMIFSTQHGIKDGEYEYYRILENHNKKCIEDEALEKMIKFGFGVEAYWVKDRFQKDNTNNHIIILASSQKGRKCINKILSEANKTGYYYRPRVDEELILSLPKDEVFVTSACLGFGGYGEDYTEEFILKLKNHFKNNFMLEIQSHATKKQIEWNKFILKMSKKHNIELIAGVDSHFIYSNQSKERDAYLESNGIRYENEDGWFMDYPDYETLFNRFKRQNLFSEQQIKDAINNTNLLLEFDDIIFDNDIKLPSIHNNLSQKDKNEKLRNILRNEFKKTANSKNKKYTEAIKTEVNVVEETKFADYFLFNYEMIKLGKKNGGKLTLTSRGCFTKDALVLTENNLKPINEIKKGDMVLTEDGNFNKVLETFDYDIEEDMIQFEYVRQGSSYKKYINKCTIDHKILTRDGWKKAEDLKVGDSLCCPKIKESNLDIVYDLNDYNFEGYDYDDNFIYEKRPVSTKYKYSPKWFQENTNISQNWCKEVINNKDYKPIRKKGFSNLEEFYKITPFKSLDNYRMYCKKHGFKSYKTPRYIKMNYLWNTFIGCMYGDGWTNKNSGIGFAINNTSKNSFNRYVFYKIAEKLGHDVYVNKSKNKNLIQLTINSKIMNNLFKTEFFKSKKGEQKIFNEKLLKQNKQNLKFLYNGLMKTDGSINKKENKISFDNTSKSIISAFKIISNIIKKSPMALDVRLSHTDKRGYKNKESYKIRGCVLDKKIKFEEDKDYWYLPVTKIIKHKNVKTKVYDIHVENFQSYTINNIIVHNSAPSWYINNLLGFTTIDRVNSEILMYPERFATADRILKSKSLFDIDFNVADPKPFIDAQKELLGEDNSYYMVAYGKLKEKSAWKMYAKVKNVEFELANKVSKQIEKFEKDYKHAEEDEKGFLNVYDYIDKEYHDIYDNSKVYQGIINSISPSPCSHLLLGSPISEDVSLIKIKNELCACIDGVTAESFGYMKNDLLTVTVVDIIYKTYEKIGIDPHPLPELIKITTGDEKTWDIYKKGLTMCINQCERDSTTAKVKKFCPNNIAELSDFVAVIRPGASSIVDKFLKREDFEYGIKEIDDLIQTEFKPSSFLLYQEEIMKLLAYAGFEASETYTILKGIAKKKPEVVEKAKGKFYSGFLSKGYDEKDIDTFWHVMELNASYSFNASHSYSVAGDSLYEAYFKAHHTYEFYEVILNLYSEKKDNDRVAKIKQEMKSGFGISVGELKLRNDNREFISDKPNKRINQSLLSCKNINQSTANLLYMIGNTSPKTFKDLLNIIKGYNNISGIIPTDLSNKIIINKTKLETLIKINYFSDFAKPKKLFRFLEHYNELHKNKTFSKEKISKELKKYLTHGEYYDNIYIQNKRIKNELITPDMEIVKRSAKTSLVNYHKSVRKLPYCEETDKMYKNVDVDKVLDIIWNDLPDQDFDIITTIQNELEFLGYIQTPIPIGTIVFDVKFSGKSKAGNVGAWMISKRNGNASWFTFEKGLKLPPKDSIIILDHTDLYKGKKSYKILNYNIVKE